MKKIYLFAAMAAMLASCSSDDLTVEKQSQKTQQTDGQAVLFDAYAQRGTTRAGIAKDINTAQLQQPFTSGGGFGVFAYYTENKEYDQQATPNFMYNQLVTYADGTWKYDPVKYWPNEYGQTAVSADQEKISFFAYAPYVYVDPASGKLVDENHTPKNFGNADTGITALSRNTAAGDPIVKYVATFEANNAVDLLWGVCEQNTWAKTVDGEQQTFTFGMPWIDAQRPYNTAERMQFTFKHATAKMLVKINHFVDDVKAGNNLATETRIYIRSVRFNGFAMKGALNLNNEDPNKPHWLNYNGVGDLESSGDVVVYDGRRDGKEAMPNATASNEKSLGLNKAFIETEKAIGTDAWSTAEGSPSGVTKTPTNLFDEGGIFYVIPIPDTDVEVEIVYDVETIDKNLAGYIADGTTHGSSVENHITKTILFGSEKYLEAGKAYTINLHLGMNSVKFDAEVTDWEDMLPESDIDLPANMPTFAANSSSATDDLAIPGSATEYIFAVSGLTGGETVAATGTNFGSVDNVIINSTSEFGITGEGHANASGVAYVKVTNITKNTDVVNKSETGANEIVIKGAHGNQITLTVTQLAEELTLDEPTTKTPADFYVFETNAKEETYLVEPNGTDAASYNETEKKWNGKSYIYVWHNGAELEKADEPAVGKFKVEWDNGYKVSFATGSVKKGDQIKIAVKTGNVAEKTVFFTVQ